MNQPRYRTVGDLYSVEAVSTKAERMYLRVVVGHWRGCALVGTSSHGGLYVAGDDYEYDEIGSPRFHKDGRRTLLWPPE